MKKFDQERAALERRLAEMGQLTESMVTLSCGAMRNRSADVFAEVARQEERMDELQLSIDHEAVRMLTVYSPVAADLRYVLTVSHMTAQLERIGDQAVNLCESIQLMATNGHDTPLPKLEEMARGVSEMVHDALDAYFQRDPAKAKATLARDDLIDSLNDQITRELLSDEVVREHLRGAADIAAALAQILIARSLERIADHATNICEEVFYLVRGDDIRHRH
jgi:phosphate transport system protein